MTTQTQQILSWLKQHRGLTPLDALRLFKCFRLAARVGELRKQGHDIKRQLITTADGKRIARYHLG